MEEGEYKKVTEVPDGRIFELEALTLILYVCLKHWTQWAD